MSKLDIDYVPPRSLNTETLPFGCKWILSVLSKAISKTVSAMESYEFSDAASTVYSWWQYQFCDVFIEVIKPYFTGNDLSARNSAQDTLWVCLDNGLRLLHPFMPFVTEELWQRLPQSNDHTGRESIMISEYPQVLEAWTNERVEFEMDLVESTVKCIRSLRGEVLGKQKNERLPAFAFCQSDAVAEIVRSHELEIITLATLSSFKVLLGGNDDDPPVGCAFENVNENLKIYLEVHGKVDLEGELEKIRNKMDEAQRQFEKLEETVKVSTYREKAPSHVQEADTVKLTKLLQDMAFYKKESVRLEAEIGKTA